LSILSSSDRSDIIRGLLAGVLLGILLVVVALIMIACATGAPQHSAGGWRIMQPGVTIVQTPCALLYIEVKANADMSTFYWRIAVVPRPIELKPTPEPKPPEA